MAVEQDGVPAAPVTQSGDDNPTSAGGALTGVPSMIGGYRLLRKLGEGGMGVVYEAEQPHPRRLVALKVIRGGRFVLDDHVKLFQREAQVLARLKHPSIAAIYQTGRTDDGQHFFAMELVRGVPLSEYLQQRMSNASHAAELRTRLRLFLKICDAINYAHQRGVIHRDLKPSNILVDTSVTPAGTGSHVVPEIKVLDFGLARITDADVAVTLHVTEAGRVQGTLAYMSPEQARGNPDEIDLRSDVYSLGVILYGLITGRAPYDIDGMATFEAVRVICETPPRPMERGFRETRVRTSEATRIDRDIETIALKALDKAPSRRYQSAAALAEDIERYLNNQPILARPVSTVYQLRKFISRHKAPFAFAVALLVLLTTFAIAMAVQSTRIARERDRARGAEARQAQEAEIAKQVSEFLLDLFKVSDPSEARGNKITAREILDKGSDRIARELQDQPVLQARMMDTMGRVYYRVGLYDRAAPLLESALAIRRRTLNPGDVEIAETLNNLGELHFEKGDLAEAERLFREALEIQRQGLGNERLTVTVTGTQNNLAMTIRRKETAAATAEAEELYRTALATRRQLLGREHADIAQNLVNLGMLLYANKRDYAAAETMLREALAMNRKLLGDEHPEVSINMNNLGLVLRDRGEYTEAEQLLRRVLELDRKILGAEHPTIAIVLNNLANLLQRKGDYSSAEAVYHEALDLKRKTFSESHWEVATVKSLLGACLMQARRYGEAEPLLLESYPAIRSSFGDAHNRTAVALRRIVELYEAWGRPQQAAAYRALQSGVAPIGR